MNSPDPEKIAKLPKWARVYIQDLERRAEAASGQLDEYINERQEGKILVSDLVCDSERTRCVEYRVNAEKIEIQHAEVWLNINVHRENHIFLSWGSGNKPSCLGDACFIPEAYQQARIVHPSKSYPGMIR